MSGRYTAQEMRDMALVEEAFGWDVSADMLLQAADMMEREEKRDYEYSVYPPEVNGVFQYRAGAELKAFILKLAGCGDGTIVRRSVGEWEDV